MSDARNGVSHALHILQAKGHVDASLSFTSLPSSGKAPRSARLRCAPMLTRLGEGLGSHDAASPRIACDMKCAFCRRRDL